MKRKDVWLPMKSSKRPHEMISIERASPQNLPLAFGSQGGLIAAPMPRLCAAFPR